MSEVTARESNLNESKLSEPNLNRSKQVPALACTDLSMAYTDAGGRLEILSGIDLEVRAGEKVAIIGVSGAGKSTLLHLLGGLERPTGGEVRVAGQRLAGLSPAALSRLRNAHLGFVYQFHHLLPEFDALENVAMPLLLGGTAVGEALATARRLLIDLGLGERLHHRPAELSGGERQRVAIARALVTEPGCVLADEPTGNLDPATAYRVFEQLTLLQDSHATALVMVTHNEALASRLDRVLVLEGGHLRPA